MQNFINVMCLLLLTVGLAAQDWNREDVKTYYSFDEFEEILSRDNDTTYVVNFWATWCAPCVKELPYFEKMNSSLASDKLKVVLVSLDFEKHIDSRLIPFLNERKIESEVVLLLDKKESQWIDRVDPEWSGAIPITVVYNNEKRGFYERVFHSEKELKDLIYEYINL